MAELQSRSLEPRNDPHDDDLKLINGIGPGIESRLQASGIYTYAQLAMLTPEEVAARVGKLIGMSAARVVEQDWIGQARTLASESAKAEIDQEIPNSHQHYASFSIELLLDKDNNVRRTKAQHIQSQAIDTWAGWEEARLLNFINENADLRLYAQQAELISGQFQESIGPGSASAAVRKLTPAVPKVAGFMRLGDMVIGTAETESSQRFVSGDQPFDISLNLDLTDLIAPQDVAVGYSAMVYAKKVGDGERKMVGSSVGMFLPADRVKLDVKDIQLARGIYRIEAFVELKPSPENIKPVSGLMAMTEGSLLHII